MRLGHAECRKSRGLGLGHDLQQLERLRAAKAEDRGGYDERVI
jgi:hypothetical protein